MFQSMGPSGTHMWFLCATKIAISVQLIYAYDVKDVVTN
jgi:hypothetical protein